MSEIPQTPVPATLVLALILLSAACTAALLGWKDRHRITPENAHQYLTPDDRAFVDQLLKKTRDKLNQPPTDPR